MILIYTFSPTCTCTVKPVYPDTLGPNETVLFTEVSLFHRFIYTHLYCIGATTTCPDVLILECRANWRTGEITSSTIISADMNINTFQTGDVLFICLHGSNVVIRGFAKRCSEKFIFLHVFQWFLKV